MPLEAGTRLGPYEILNAIGAGGMGEVYRATDSRLKRDVAIKVLPEPFEHDPDRLARFQREAELLASLNHPNIAAIYGLESAEGAVAIVLELVEGETLEGLVRRGPLAIHEALPIARQIVEALEAAHDKGVVHRDLKPANIKMTADGRVKVLDFGLAKMLEADPKSSAMSMSPTLSVHATYSGVILGTAAYMSPEQARGKPVDRRADVWAFGCVLYEMLTGTHAFDPGETVSDAIASVLTREPDLNALPADTPRPIRRLLRRCLQKDPQQRLPHIGAARLEIDEARTGSHDEQPAAVVTEPMTVITRTSRWRRAVPVASALIVGGALAGYGGWRLRPDPPRSVTRFSVMLPEGQTFTNPGRQLVALSPDGSNLVYVANNRLYIRSMATLEVHAIAGSEAGGQGITGPAFSPDGQSLAFWSAAERAVKRLALSGGAPVTVCPSDNPLGLSWGEGGIVFGQVGKGILRVSPNGGTPDVIVPVQAEEEACCPQLLPGGSAVLYTVRKNEVANEKARILAQRFGTGARTTVIDGGTDGRYMSTGHLVYALAGGLLAVPFDVTRLETTGGPVPVLEGVRRSATGAAVGGVGIAQFSVADNGTIAYLPGPAAGPADGNYDFGLFDRSGRMQALKLPPGSYRAPRISPDGKTVAFDNEDSRDANVWMYDLAGGGAPRRLTNGGKNRSPVWSPDGQWIAFQSEREGDAAIFRERADGTGLAERLTKPDAGARHSPQSWSRDGTSLLMTVEKDSQFALWTLSIKDKQTTPFDDVKSVTQIEASFSPDGRWVAYTARESMNRQNPNEVFLQPFPSTGIKHLVPQAGGAPYWLPKTNELVLNAGPSRNVAVAVTTTPRVAFGRPTDFSRAGRFEGSPRTSRRNVDAMPDGEHVIGVVPASGIESSVAAQITVVLNWFNEVRQRVPVK